MVPAGAAVCPHCGAAREKRIPLALIAAFFIIGVLLGLLFIDSAYYGEMRRVVYAFVEAEDEPSETPSRQEASPRRQASARVVPESGSEAGVSAEGGGAQGKAPETLTEALLCDMEVARRVRLKAREIAEISESEGVLRVRLRRQWAYYSPGVRRSFFTAFAESDACLQGRTREIHFYYNGEKIAVSRAPGGLRRLAE